MVFLEAQVGGTPHTWTNVTNFIAIDCKTPKREIKCRLVHDVKPKKIIDCLEVDEMDYEMNYREFLPPTLAAESSLRP
jgi:hypothetical protein